MGHLWRRVTASVTFFGYYTFSNYFFLKERWKNYDFSSSQKMWPNLSPVAADDRLRKNILFLSFFLKEALNKNCIAVAAKKCERTCHCPCRSRWLRKCILFTIISIWRSAQKIVFSLTVKKYECNIYRRVRPTQDACWMDGNRSHARITHTNIDIYYTRIL